MTSYMTLDLSDYPEADSIAAALYIDGCDRKCLGCHNKALQDKLGTDDKTLILANLREYLNSRNLNKVVLLGGDPLYAENLSLTLLLIERLQDIDFCIYTGGDTVEINQKLPLLPNIKYVKGGNYKKCFAVAPLKTSNGMQLASTNQFFLNREREMISHQGYLNFYHRR